MANDDMHKEMTVRCEGEADARDRERVNGKRCEWLCGCVVVLRVSALRDSLGRLLLGWACWG